MIINIYIETNKLDLFKDDNIVLKSSIVEIEDVNKIFTDSTNSFSVPATPNNNKIFKHFYNQKIVDGWDVFSKVDATIDIDGVMFKQGKIQLNSVTLKSNEPTSYDIQFYGLLTSLKDILSDDKLSSLDLSDFDFTFNSANVVSKLTSTPSDLVCTTLSTRRMIYDSNSAKNNTLSIKNIANNNTGFTSGLEWNFTSVSILNIHIIEAIEEKYGITFSRDFFGKLAFSNLYLLLNGSSVENEIEQQVVFDTFTVDPSLEANRILLSTNLPFSETDILRISINCQGANKTEKFTSIIRANGKEIHSVTANGNSSGLYVYIVKKSDFPIFENLTFHLKSASALDYRFTVDRNTLPLPTYKSEKAYSVLTGNFNVSSRMPDLTILNYLKGLFQQFKLIAINTSETEIYVDTLNKYYQNGVVKDFNKYLDNKEIPISTGKIFSEINYKFKEPQTLLAKQFFQNNAVNYGDLEFKLIDVNNKKVEGESIDIELPFENMIYEKLLDLNGLSDLNFMYGYMADESLNAVNVKAHLHYVENIATTSTIKILTGTSSYTTTNLINVPTHTLGFNSPIHSLVFGEEFNEYNGVLIQETLYKNYHRNYIENAFNKNKRMFKFKLRNVETPTLLNLKLNDILDIKEDYFQIEKYNVNLITKEIELEVYNIKEFFEIPFSEFSWDKTTITFDSTIVTFDKN